MNKEEIRLQSRVDEQVKKWAEEFLMSEDEIWYALRSFADYHFLLRVSVFANSSKVSMDSFFGLCKQIQSLAVEKEGNNELN